MIESSPARAEPLRVTRPSCGAPVPMDVPSNLHERRSFVFVEAISGKHRNFERASSLNHKSIPRPDGMEGVTRTIPGGMARDKIRVGR